VNYRFNPIEWKKSTDRFAELNGCKNLNRRSRNRNRARRDKNLLDRLHRIRILEARTAFQRRCNTVRGCMAMNHQMVLVTRPCLVMDVLRRYHGESADRQRQSEG